MATCIWHQHRGIFATLIAPYPVSLFEKSLEILRLLHTGRRCPNYQKGNIGSKRSWGWEAKLKSPLSEVLRKKNHPLLLLRSEGTCYHFITTSVHTENTCALGRSYNCKNTYFKRYSLQFHKRCEPSNKKERKRASPTFFNGTLKTDQLRLWINLLPALRLQGRLRLL